MTVELSTSEQLLLTTVRLECFKSGTPSYGSGFFYQFLVDDKNSIPFLVTNKHVIAGADIGTFHVHLYDPDNRSAPSQIAQVRLPNLQNHWISHPDPSVDLCGMGIGPIMEILRKGNHELLYRSMDKKFLPNDQQAKDLSPIESVIMIGYPTGIWDSVNNMPIVRRGITATNFATDFKGLKEFLVDMAIFPGSSGSPVFILNEGNYTDKRGSLVLGKRLFFLGVLFAGPMYPAKGKMKVVPIPTAESSDTISNVPMNLGYIIKSSRVEELAEEIYKTVNMAG